MTYQRPRSLASLSSTGHLRVAFSFLEIQLMTEPVSLIEDLLVRLDPEMRYLFEERAGIIEFDAEQPRDTAEYLALIDLLRSHPGALLGLTVLQVECGPLTRFVLTTDVEFARQHLADLDLTVVGSLEPAELVADHFNGVALLTRLG